MARPTFPTCRTIIAGSTVIDASIANAKLAGSINGSKLMTSAIGLTAAATVLERRLTVVQLTATLVVGQTYTVFRGPTSGAKITAAAWTPGALQNHAVNSSQTWAMRLYNKRTGNSLNAKGCSLSNMTLAATAWKTIPIDNGYATVQAGETLWASFGISGSPAAMNFPAVALEWIPLNNV